MRRLVAFIHPSGLRVEAVGYDPLVIDGTRRGGPRHSVAYRADGSPADLCAGWAAHVRRGARVGLIACSARKLAAPAPARDFYQGDLFKLSRSWMEQNEEIDVWAVLSAKHGLVMPDEVVEPYDLSLTELPIDQRRAWCDRVRGQLLEQWGDGSVFAVLAGATYRAALSGLPYVDVISGWHPRPRGIGQIKQCIKRDLRKAAA